MDRTAYYVKYKSGEPVEINSIIFLKHNGIPLTTVGHLIKAFKNEVVPSLNNFPLDQLTLHSVIDGVETKHNSYDKITDIKEAAGTGPNPLIIYAKQISENEQTHQKPSEELNTEGIERDMMEKITLHDMQQDTAIIEKIKGNDSVVYLGKTNEQKLSNEGINLDDEKTVKREETVKEIILQLKETGVLLIKSPPMTGKTSLATLAADYLCNLIINISMVDFNNRVDNWDFQQTFYKELGIRWGDLADYRKVREIYLIMDEVQLLYTRNGNNADNRPFSPSHNSRCVWNMVKSILGGYDGVNILLFAAYGSSVQNLEFSTPVKLEEGRTMFGITWTIFKDDELQEYVRKHLRCYNSVLHKDKQAMNEFCFNIQKLTGSYVGLVRDAIIAINDEFISDEKRFTIDVKKLIKSVWMQRVYKKLLDTRAIRAVKNIVSKNDLELVKSLLFGDSSMELDEMNTSLVKNWCW
ncbi:hypothetical protein HK103_002980 [Boothiomyces macroporosus]|uniref:Uncharacterized protein n=1 Tax=Boothiomyces macroporosus TaxID=261099 RepID=A0AAD5Y4W1_9FUNG|nr:hypothetical protein HK103_002980 [Boothiomyces macroporosus]